MAGAGGVVVVVVVVGGAATAAETAAASFMEVGSTRLVGSDALFGEASSLLAGLGDDAVDAVEAVDAVVAFDSDLT